MALHQSDSASEKWSIHGINSRIVRIPTLTTIPSGIPLERKIDPRVDLNEKFFQSLAPNISKTYRTLTMLIISGVWPPISTKMKDLASNAFTFINMHIETPIAFLFSPWNGFQAWLSSRPELFRYRNNQVLGFMVGLACIKPKSIHAPFIAVDFLEKHCYDLTSAISNQHVSTRLSQTRSWPIKRISRLASYGSIKVPTTVDWLWRRDRRLFKSMNNTFYWLHCVLTLL